MINRWAHVVTDYPKAVCCMVLLLVSISLLKIPLIEFDTSTRGYLKTDHASIVSYDDFRENFGPDEFIVLAIEHDNIFSRDFLENFKYFSKPCIQQCPI